MERRTQERLRDIANGGWESMDPATRRCMIVLAEELDAVHESHRKLGKKVDDALESVKRELADTRKTVIALMSAIIVTVVASGILNVWTK